MWSGLGRQLVGLYPRAWRARYEDEFVALPQPVSLAREVRRDVISTIALISLIYPPLGHSR
jgi:hypothetical protein